MQHTQLWKPFSMLLLLNLAVWELLPMLCFSTWTGQRLYPIVLTWQRL